MAGGWSKDGAVQEQIDASVDDAIKIARERLPKGESATRCDECDTQIPDRRRQAVPGVRLCLMCQEEVDANEAATSSLNRRGSKDSQLR